MAMSETNFASLNPTLLARKGGAKPAMRPQLAPLPDASMTDPGEKLEDLGWNDMGSEKPHGGQVVSLKPMGASDANADSKAESEAAHKDARSQQEEISDRIGAATPKAKQPTKRVSAFSRGKRAAFTLRLDKERHLKLRLASTILGQSAQQVVTRALDELLENIDELDSLVAKVKRD